MTPERGNQGSLQDVPKVLLSVQQVLRKLRRHLVDLGLMCALHEDGEAAQGLLVEWKCTFVGVRGCAYHFTATAMTSLLESFASRSRMAVQILGGTAWGIRQWSDQGHHACINKLVCVPLLQRRV